MPTPLRVLVLEDVEADAELSLRELRRGGFEPRSRRVETGAAFAEALAQDWDVILADYHLPGFDAEHALRMVRDRGVDAPFIVVSGAIGEEKAVAMMRGGARDYVMKDDIGRLAPAVERELREASTRRSHRAARAALRASEERFRNGVEASPIGMALMDPGGRFLDVNPALGAMLGDNAAELAKLSLSDVSHDEDTPNVLAQLHAVAAGAASCFEREQRLVHSDGSVVWARLSVCGLERTDGRPAALHAQIQDVTDRKRAEMRLEHRATHDPLTDLPNRVLFLEHLRHALARSERSEGLVAVVFVDVDGFKPINDRFGHAVGDQLLVTVAGRLARALGPDVVVSRLGGDEYVALLEDVVHRDDGFAAAGRARQSFSRPFPVAGRDMTITASVGLAFAAGPHERPEELVSRADAAMYHAKRAKGGLRVFDEDMYEVLVRRQETELGLREALERDQLRLFYQPVVEIADGSLRAVEALLRWDHPDQGLLAAASFIELTEECGLMPSIGAWVLEQACLQLGAWDRAGPGGPPEVYVNLSGHQLAQPDFPDVVSAALRRTGIDASRVCLEVTETRVFDGAADLRVVLHVLRALGFRLAIDDFGTGYSTLSRLVDFPVDALKIDRTFVHGLGEDAQDLAVVKAVCGLAQSLGLVTVAEGVETDRQLAMLADLGCDLAQGYLLGHPVPAETITERILGGRRPRAAASGAAEAPG